MHSVRIEHAVPNFESWKQAFDRDPADRKGAGVRSYRVLRRHAEPNYVYIDLEFDSLGEAERFVGKMRQIWAGPARAIALNPSVQIADSVEHVLIDG